MGVDKSNVMHVYFSVIVIYLCFFVIKLTNYVCVCVCVCCRRVVSWHRPFCVDLQEGTFSLLRTFIELYCAFDIFDIPIKPFTSIR